MTVCVTNTTGATWIAGRDCSALISLKTPTPDAAAVESAHAAASPIRPWKRSFDASFVATPLHPNPRPAPSIVITAGERAMAWSRYGSMLASASPTSTSVIVKRPASWVVRAGAARPMPSPPIAIASIATCS